MLYHENHENLSLSLQNVYILSACASRQFICLTDVIVCEQQPHQRPLTRYLPIRSESLNLRQHIETAGHQIELCVHVSLDSTSCRGYLHKMGSKFHNWNRRWFVFDRLRRTLTYYSDRGEKKPRGGVYFQVKSLINSYYKFRC